MSENGKPRRDFLYVATGGLALVGAGAAGWTAINSLNPAADIELPGFEVDLSAVAEGQSITVAWRGKPVFIRHRTPAEIEAARSVDLSDLRDPQSDAERVIRPEWLIVVGVCTHMGCVPLGQSGTGPHGTDGPRGDYGGWFCPCHGAHFDTSGRVRKGPAPINMTVPPYRFLDDDRVRIGVGEETLMPM